MFINDWKTKGAQLTDAVAALVLILLYDAAFSVAGGHGRHA